MILCYFLKVLTEMAFYYVCANCFMGIANVAIDSFIPAIISASVASLAYWMEDKYSKYRLLTVLLLGFVFLFAKGFGTAGILFLPQLYVALCIKEKRFFVDAETQGNLFRWGLMVSFVVYFLFAVFIGVQWVVQYMLLFLFVNIFLMRLLRQNQAYLNDKKFLLTNVSNVSIALIVTALFTNNFVVGLVKSGMVWLYEHAIEPLMEYVILGIFLLGRMFYVFFFEILKPGIKPKKWHAPDHPDHNWINEQFIAPLEEQLGTSSIFVTFLQILFFAAGICLVFFIIKKSRKGRNIQEKSTIREHRRAIVDQRPEEKISLDLMAPKEPRAAVRFYYRKFLQLCKKLDYKFPDYFTSQHIAHRVSNQFGKEAPNKIRQTYIRARYSPKSITEEDVAFMKEQVRQLKERYEPKKND